MTKTLITFFILSAFITACTPGSDISSMPVKESLSTVEIGRTVSPSPTVAEANTPTQVAPPTIIPSATQQIFINPSALAVISIENAAQLKRLATLGGHTNQVIDVTFSPTGAYLASTSFDRTIRVWDINAGEEIITLPVRAADINSIDFSPDGRYLAFAEGVYDLEARQVVKELEKISLYTGNVAYSPDGALIAIDLPGQPLHLWELASGEVIRSFEDQGENPENDTFSVVFSPDGSTLATSAHEIRILDIVSGEIIRTIDYSNGKDVHDIAFSPDGSLLVSVGIDETVRIWDVATGENLHSMSTGNGLMGVTFSPDGSLVASAGCDRTVRLWNTDSGAQLKSLSHADEVVAVAFSTDGKLIASAGYDQMITLWGVSE